MIEEIRQSIRLRALMEASDFLQSMARKEIKLYEEYLRANEHEKSQFHLARSQAIMAACLELVEERLAGETV